MTQQNKERVRYTASNITQNKKRFYSLSIPMDVLTRCCFATPREEDPLEGFQRVLDKKRAQQIAHYIDEEGGTIPSAIILSAQEVAEIDVIGKGRTIEFTIDPKSFLIIDGQHRVYGFSLSKSLLRIPVIIYSGLTKKEEAILFIDINSKQKSVPTELLLDIKRMADREATSEAILRDVFDTFDDSPDSILLGKLSPRDNTRNKISRVTFNGAMSNALKTFGNKETEEIYTILNNYISSFYNGWMKDNKIEGQLTNSTVFKAIMGAFIEIAIATKMKHGTTYSADDFIDIMKGMFLKLNPARFKNPGNSYKSLSKHITDCFKTDFEL
ncbi:DGQHR domain-containing protein [Pantoea agglomerans]